MIISGGSRGDALRISCVCCGQHVGSLFLHRLHPAGARLSAGAEQSAPRRQPPFSATYHHMDLVIIVSLNCNRGAHV